MLIVKRDGRTEEFASEKIESALRKAYKATDGCVKPLSMSQIHKITTQITKAVKSKQTVDIETIQDMVEKHLMDVRKDVAKHYILYREKRSNARKNTIDDTVREYLAGESEYWNTENSNKDAKAIPTQRDYLAGILSTDMSRRYLYPKEVIEAHDKGIIHVNDMDYRAQAGITNCCLINLKDMLQNGTVVNKVKIDKQHKLLTATTVASQIVLNVTSSQYGGCSISLAHLAPFVRDSFNRYKKKYLDWGADENTALRWASRDLKTEITDSVQTLNYQLNSMCNSNGQSPFVSVFMWIDEEPEYKNETAMLIEEVLKQRIQGFKNEKGVYVTQAFPKLLYVLDENNVYKDSPYYYLTELSAKCTAKRLVPDYISAKVMRQLKDGDVFPCMGCRSFLMPYKDENGESKYYGRFNWGVCTLNLPDVALSSKGFYEDFWRLLDERLELIHEVHKCTYKRLAKATSDVAPILWQYGAFTRIGKHESIEPFLKNNYSSVSIGYGGLYECVKYMTGHSHTDNGVGHEFALKVMKHLKDTADRWQKEENIGYSVYGSPMESTVYKFAKCLKKRFGNDVFIKLDGKDRDYITNSVHVPVFEKIDIFSKLKLEAEFQSYSSGGYISYGEVPNMQDNIPAVIKIIQFIYDNIMYAELNTKSDYCMECGYDGEIKTVADEKGRLVWECPNCGNRDTDKMSVARRTCGYIGTNYWNAGRTQEIAERVLHVD